ncbi:MAG TPA: FAD-binding protein, partial [Prolixibacteraceae bacterium]|nr:FAD-binding protein [Prolixibacteraceae bacterium]
EGAWLLNEKGERFMKDIHPLAELAPRDVVAFSIYKQIRKSDAPHVFLSLKHLDADKIKKRFHHIYQQLKTYGFDLTQDLLPISPAAHYMVGGIRTNVDAETNIPGLFVCGEAASTGVMGANRLASNSLLECLVFGKRASEKASKLKSNVCTLPHTKAVTVNQSNEKLFLKFQNEISSVMSSNLGIVRNGQDMQKSLLKINQIAAEFNNIEGEFNKLKIKNAAVICQLIIRSALTREESRGGHIRDDFQKENLDFRKHIIQQKDEKIEFEPVRT